MNRGRLAAPLLAMLVACSLLAPAWAQEGAPVPPRFLGKLEPCDRPGFPDRTLCGRYEVYEKRSARAGRRLALQVAVLPAKGEPADDAFTFLAGGGVLPATRMVPFLDRRFSKLNEGRDLVLVDQRGTGRSGALECEAPGWQRVLSGERSRRDYMKALERCRDLLGRYTDLRSYTTAMAADDLDEIRSWLGYEALSIWGASYGTKVARVYARRHPERVRTLVLHGTVPLQFSMWPDLGPSGVRALERLLDRCESDTACRQAYPESRRALGTILARLARDPVDADRPEGERGPKEVNDRVAASVIMSALGEMRMARGIPLWIHAAAQGDDSFLARLSASGPSEVPLGVYYSIACSEEFGRPDGPPRAKSTSISPAFSPFLQIGVLERDQEVCRFWPKAELPKGFWQPVESAVPTLFVTGSEDFITPPRYARQVAEGFPNSDQLVPPERSHNDLDACVGGLIERFLIRPDTSSLDTSCLEETSQFRFRRPGEARR